MTKRFWKAEKSDVWHWCSNCSSGRKVAKQRGRVVRDGTAGSGELCGECLAKQKNDGCQEVAADGH